MKSINWKFVFLPITFVLSILAGIWMATQTIFIQEILRTISLQKADIGIVRYQKPFTTQLYHAAEFLVAFAIPCGLVWLTYFTITRLLTTRTRER
ncbi:hypothetical protein F4083_12385 [Candidatus Poribacteria bacterium]|nr:hypothetical protein [Candidatus Poribacteria bacterium]MYF54548.1 hypothetical protein [Candidatus Poribacteria bacterium]MYI95094.1 hypothetical protein [Candidatus Poribacteria bacterium]